MNFVNWSDSKSGPRVKIMLEFIFDIPISFLEIMDATRTRGKRAAEKNGPLSVTAHRASGTEAGFGVSLAAHTTTPSSAFR